MMFGGNIPLANTSKGQLQALDYNENVFVIIAHDSTVRDSVEHFTKGLKSWKTKGWENKLKWAFFRDLEPYWKSQGIQYDTGHSMSH